MMFRTLATLITVGAMPSSFILAESVFPVNLVDRSESTTERQITRAPHDHVLTNVNVWSPDSRWIVYDVREGDEFNGTRIERVNVETGEVQVLYESGNGACCGVVTCNQIDGRVVFIHGPEHPSPEWQYGFTRRRGAIVDTLQLGAARALDAMNYSPPFVEGALRGGSHVHVFSPDGLWVSFTYEDEVLARLGPADQGTTHDVNQRNIGVAVPVGPVRVNRHHPHNNDGDFFSVVVSRTVNEPVPGSDEISRAFEEGWVGDAGYLRDDGSRQAKSLAFQGLVTTTDGTQHAEVFIVDLPDDLTRPGDGLLEGSEFRRPAPPFATSQRRLTFSGEWGFPGIASSPRHWLRSSPDGSQKAFLMRIDDGSVQLFTVSPEGGVEHLGSQVPGGVGSSFTWHPNGGVIAHMADNSIWLTEPARMRSTRITRRVPDSTAPLPGACVFSPDGRYIAYARRIESAGATFTQIFTEI